MLKIHLNYLRFSFVWEVVMKTRYAYSFGLVMLMAISSHGCDKGDAIGSCDTANDCPNVYTYVCRNGGCALADEPTCKDGEKNHDETDVDCGGTCPACKVGKGCKRDNDCATGKCEDNVCVDYQCSTSDECKSSGGFIMHGCGKNGLCMTCSDSLINGDETDTDCGGSCDLCEDGQRCEANTDCKSQFCSEAQICEQEDGGNPSTSSCSKDLDCGEDSRCGTDGSCNSCIDNKKNGEETDEDCGGIYCPKCGIGKACNSETDCASGVCGTSGTCEAKPQPTIPETCSNNTKDEGESDVDCGGSCPQCGMDKYCNVDDDCKSWKCVASSGATGKVCAGDGCETAAENELVINEVFTRPDESQKMMHSESNQMKFIELYNPTSKRISLNNLSLIVTKNGANTTIPLKGCMDGKTYHVLYPADKKLESLDIDATQAGVSLDVIDTSEMFMKLENKESLAIIDNVKIEPTNTDAYNGISAGRGTVSKTDDVYEVLVPHNTIPIATIPDGEDVKNLYSPGVPNTAGFPLG